MKRLIIIVTMLLIAGCSSSQEAVNNQID
ncbi:TPA: toxin, partial [Escherichia coli]